jgi:death-on-curing protein
VKFIPKQSVLGLHERSIENFGGARGLRDEGLLESALARPQNLAVYGEPDVFALAAAYAFGIVRNHPFVDGNKRAAFLAAALFLDINGVVLEAAEAEATATMLAFASGEVDEAAFAAWLRGVARPSATRRRRSSAAPKRAKAKPRRKAPPQKSR